MSQSSAGRALELISRPGLTITESAGDYDSLVKSLQQEISPRGFIEHMYVADMSAIVWESLRLRRCAAAIINMAFRAALKNLLVQFWKNPDEPAPYQESEVLAFEWFTDPNAKQRVAEILNKFHLDETAIEAEAIRSVAADLELLDRMLMSLEARRNRALRSIADYRASFAEKVQQVSDRIINAEPLLRIRQPAGGASA
ncbi:MAG TPA: hypothetical protein VNZ53_02055 [Steroidobacteraceae bacterium]|jgi:hypothetical protein|uniref:hypothetical protein n=1 Tax=Bradyrhizobium sp. TaxID=376 RepID=UPI002C2A2B4D|nr:hypothetical protein [Bradyrhizobium sp.]HWX26206.1 hypothetical protein [Steroidobacteraceae bacterium]HXB77032.1 hypothetical protein [Bradyrhizobium sp.]